MLASTAHVHDPSMTPGVQVYASPRIHISLDLLTCSQVVTYSLTGLREHSETLIGSDEKQGPSKYDLRSTPFNSTILRITSQDSVWPCDHSKSSNSPHYNLGREAYLPSVPHSTKFTLLCTFCNLH